MSCYENIKWECSDKNGKCKHGLGEYCPARNGDKCSIINKPCNSENCLPYHWIDILFTNIPEALSEDKIKELLEDMINNIYVDDGHVFY